MPTLRDIPFTLTVRDLLEAQGPKEPRRREAIAAMAEEAVDLGQLLVAPAVLYRRFDVLAVEGEQVILGDDAPVLTIGPRADLLAPAEALFVAAYTIGSALEGRVEALYRERALVLSYLLDCVGVMALGHVGERVHRLAEAWAAERSWGVGPALSPGSLAGWPVQGQRELCALLPLAQIGVRLNPYCVLEPHKSASVVVGVGAGYEDHEVGSICRFCALRERCWRRREG